MFYFVRPVQISFYLVRAFFVIVAARNHVSYAKMSWNSECRGESARAGKVPSSPL